MKKFIKKVITGALAATMALGMSSIAYAADPDTTAETVDVDKTGSITIRKYSNHRGIEFEGFTEGVNGLESDTIPDKSYPISGVQFKYVKIADIGQYINTVSGKGEIGTYFKLTQDFITECSNRGITITPDKTDVDGTKFYSVTNLENIINTWNTDQTKVETWVNTKGTAFTETDADGITKAANLPLGIYLIAETDTKNAAIANSWLTGDDTYIKQNGLNSQNTDYSTVDVTGTDDNIYNDGIISSTTPKTKVSIASKSIPYLVSIPTTNTTAIGNNAAGTVWMYDVYTKPKNTVTSITKMIVDQDDNKTLRIYEDYEIGDTVNYTIFADVEPLMGDKKHTEFIIDDNMTDGLTFNEISSVTYGLRTKNPTTTDDFAGYTAFTSSDYTVTKTEHAFKITFTATGLAKLDAITDTNLVVVQFSCILNEAAKIGTVPQNMNRSDLTWKNTYESEYKISSNKVFAFTYQTDIQKEGITKPEQVSFRLQRYNKTTGALIDGDIACVKDSDGMYHIFDNAHDDEADKVTQLVLGQDCKIHVRGVDSERYKIVEVTTQQGKNLLKHAFDVDLTAPDKAEGTLVNPAVETTTNHRNGTVTANAITVDGTSSTNLTEKTIPLFTEEGIVYITIINNDVVSLKTGGSGTAIYYIISALMLLGCASIAVYAKRKRA